MAAAVVAAAVALVAALVAAEDEESLVAAAEEVASVAAAVDVAAAAVVVSAEVVVAAAEVDVSAAAVDVDEAAVVVFELSTDILQVRATSIIAWPLLVTGVIVISHVSVTMPCDLYPSLSRCRFIIYNTHVIFWSLVLNVTGPVTSAVPSPLLMTRVLVVFDDDLDDLSVAGAARASPAAKSMASMERRKVGAKCSIVARGYCETENGRGSRDQL